MSTPLQTHVAYEALFQHSSLGIIVSNAEGVIEQVNPFASRLFGYSDRELVGQKIEVLIPTRLKGRHEAHRTHYHAHPKPRAMGIGMDLWAVRKDGSEFPVEISLANYDSDGRKQVVSFVNDITERKAAEDALRRLNSDLEQKVAERTNELSQAIIELQHINTHLQQEMEQRRRAEADARQAFERERELNELKSRFVSMASHEFRTPLSGILTSIALIARYIESGDADKCQRHIQTIRAAVKNLTNILNDFLSLDKLEQGRVECRPSDFSLRELVQEVLDDDRIRYEHLSASDDVRLDRDMLRNVLLNLLSNASKYSPGDRPIQVRTTLEDDIVTLVVQDEGIGIPEAEQKHLFERFFRAHNAGTIQGTGLGLNIVQRYLDLMHGAIACESRENIGTTFTVTLPRRLA